MGPKKTPEQKPPRGRAMIIETSDNEFDESPTVGPRKPLNVAPKRNLKNSDTDVNTVTKNKDNVVYTDTKNKDKVVNTDTKEAIYLRPKWVLVAGCVVAVAVLYMYIQMPSRKELDLLVAKLDKMKISHGKIFSEDIEELEKKLDDRYNSLERQINKTTDNIDGLREKVEQLSGKFEGLIDKFDIHKHDVHGKIQTLSNELASAEHNLREDMKSIKTDLGKKLDEESSRMSSLEKKHDNTHEKVETTDADVKNLLITLETFRENDKEHDNRIQIVEKIVGGYNTIIDEQAKELSERMRAASATLRDYNDKIQKMKDKVSINEKDIDTAFDNLFNKNVALVVIILILAMNFGLIVAVYTLCQGPTPRVGSRQPHGVRQNDPKREYYNLVLNQIPVAPTLKKAIGVISFTGEYQPGHLIRSVTDIRHNIDIEYHVILTDEDITNIPRCSLIVIFVEYSDRNFRNVIIEESGYDLSDCNKTTLAAAQKIRATPVIVYCKDLSSQRLQPDRLFNKRIRCATHQKELIPLSDNNRFFSVYDDFSENQKTAFKNLITDHVL